MELVYSYPSLLNAWVQELMMMAMVWEFRVNAIF